MRHARKQENMAHTQEEEGSQQKLKQLKLRIYQTETVIYLSVFKELKETIYKELKEDNHSLSPNREQQLLGRNDRKEPNKFWL